MRRAWLVVAVLALACPARASERARIAVIEAGAGLEVRAAVSAALAPTATVLDAALVDAAVAGAGYSGSVNLTREETRRLGLVTGSDALAIAVISDVERESDNDSGQWDSFIGLLLADGRTGELLRYKGVRAVADSRAAARGRALEAAQAEVATWGALVEGARARRIGGETTAWDPAAVEFGTATQEVDGLVPPRFFRRPAPTFTEDADRMRIAATVDLVVQFNADGTYGPIEVARWAGFGLDEAAIEAVRACRFWPARRSNRPIPARALLRYNFRFRDR